MSNLAKLEIAALDVTGNNYMTWASDAKMHLKGNGLLSTINRSIATSEELKAKAMIFLRHHLYDHLKMEYIRKENPADLWQSLKEMFDHQKYVILPKAKQEWLNLRFQDYKCVSEYNSALFRITSRMMLCGENVSDHDMIEKILQTFHPGNVVLQQQYRARGLTQYSELMQILLVAEQNNELAIMNHQVRPTDSAPFPDVNVVASSSNDSLGRGRGRRRGRGRGCGRGRGGGRGCGRGFQSNYSNAEKTNEVGRVVKNKNKHTCYRCGMRAHWLRTCHTPKHLADLYQESLKAKGKDAETNFISGELRPSFNDLSEDVHYDVADFLVDSEISTGNKRTRIEDA